MGLVSRGIYRSRQAWRTLQARPLSEERKREIAQLLTAEQLALFESQSYAVQQHGYRVMNTLSRAGHKKKELLVAALLHDAGKDVLGYTWLDRVKVVLTQRLAPRLADGWARATPTGWTKAFVVKACHAEWGAQRLAGAGGSDLSVALVRKHQDPILASDEDSEENRLLALLQWADDQS